MQAGLVRSVVLQYGWPLCQRGVSESGANQANYYNGALSRKTLCVGQRDGQSAVSSVCITVKLTEEKPQLHFPLGASSINVCMEAVTVLAFSGHVRHAPQTGNG